MDCESGMVFGRLTAIEFVRKDKYNNAVWLFECSCGKRKEIYRNAVVHGKTRSCGCYQAEMNKTPKFIKHNSCNTRLYRIWAHMKERCNNSRCKVYKDYGGRGIKICEDWNDFRNFEQWAINNGYLENLTIDRIDNNGNYEPSNCRWTTMSVQANNKRNNVFYEAYGEKHTISEWARIKGINEGTLRSRIMRNKWNIEKALSV